MKLKRILSLLLCAALLLPAFINTHADNSDIRTVIGADLSSQQVDTIYDMFGLKRGGCIEMTVTNAEERSYLQGLVDDSTIGTRSISSVYFRKLPSGSGLKITTQNITYCTPEMYANALITAGITDAEIIVAAPFEVSGTSALTGMFKAYEDITGKTLDKTAKQAGTQELTVAGVLGNEYDDSDTNKIVNELKGMLDVTAKMSDSELKSKIKTISAKYGVNLSDGQLDMLVKLCRSFEKLDPDEIKQQMQKLQQTVGEYTEKASGFGEKLKRFWDWLMGLFN